MYNYAVNVLLMWKHIEFTYLTHLFIYKSIHGKMIENSTILRWEFEAYCPLAISMFALMM